MISVIYSNINDLLLCRGDTKQTFEVLSFIYNTHEITLVLFGTHLLNWTRINSYLLVFRIKSNIPLQQQKCTKVQWAAINHAQ